MIHCTLNVTIFATRREMPFKVECQHIAEVTTILRYFLVDIATKYLRSVSERMGAEGMLGVKRKSEMFHAIRSGRFLHRG